MVQRFRTLLTGFASPPLGRRILQASLLFGGLAMVAIGAVFLLGSSWSEGPARSAAAALESTATRENRQTLEASPTLAASALFGRLAQSAPTATPTLDPTPTSAPLAPVPQPGEAEPQLPASEPDEPPAVASDCPTASMSGFALDLFDAINNERAQAGVAILGANGCVTLVSYLRSQDMAANNYFSHTSPAGATAFSMMDANGLRYGWAGENLARNNYPEAETVGVSIRDLMASPGHRENILSTNYSQMGVGYAEDGTGMRYYTMIFIGSP